MTVEISILSFTYYQFITKTNMPEIPVFAQAQEAIALLAAGSEATIMPFYFKALGSRIFTILEL